MQWLASIKHNVLHQQQPTAERSVAVGCLLDVIVSNFSRNIFSMLVRGCAAHELPRCIFLAYHHAYPPLPVGIMDI